MVFTNKIIKNVLTKAFSIALIIMLIGGSAVRYPIRLFRAALVKCLAIRRLHGFPGAPSLRRDDRCLGIALSGVEQGRKCFRLDFAIGVEQEGVGCVDQGNRLIVGAAKTLVGRIADDLCMRQQAG